MAAKKAAGGREPAQAPSYYGACVPGLEECIAEFLAERFPDLSISRIMSGAIVFETSCPYDRFNLFCFNNVFQVTGRAPVQESGRDVLERFVLNTLRRRAGEELLAAFSAGSRERSFRVIFSLENTPAALNGELRSRTETYIASCSGLRVNRSNPGVEFWFLLRREGAFFLRRLTRHRPWDKLLHPGELPPPLAWVLCRLSAPRPGERIADPFCGYGAIPLARLRYFPQAEFFASDIDGRVLAAARAKFGETVPRLCHFNRLDAAELPRLIPPASLDSVITDPPWGCYRGSSPGARNGPKKPNTMGRPDVTGTAEERARSAGERYNQFLGICAGLLKPGGRVVMLCGREGEPNAERNGFTLVRRIPILLSGKKAAIYVLRI